MADGYTFKNLAQVTDSAPDLGAADFQESRFAAPDFGATDVGFTHHRFKPGKRQGFGHHHETAEEYYVVLSGSGRVKLDDDILDVRPLDALRVGPAVVRAWEAGADGLEVLSFGARVDGDEERIPSDAAIDADWWTD